MTGGVGIQYQWDFDDGTPVTPFSSVARRSAHTFAKPGIYYVTRDGDRRPRAHADDDRRRADRAPAADGEPPGHVRPASRSRTAPTAATGCGSSTRTTTPSACSTPAPTRGSPSITVGNAPRALAIAPNGEVWVTNKQGATISVIDPTTLAVVAHDRAALRLAALRHRGRARPAASCTSRSRRGTPAEDRRRRATRRSRASTSARIRATSRSPATAAASMSRASSRRRCPARARRSCRRRAAARRRGRRGQRGRRCASQDTIVLRHSDKPDAENQGRGVPNYLGAVAISPDGQLGLGAVQAGQHQARRAARRPGPQLPEHGPRDQLAHRPGHGRRGLPAAHRPRQLRRRERASPSTATASTCSSPWRPAARSRSSTPTAAGRCSASTSAARRRASRCRPTADALRQQFHGPHASACSTSRRCWTRASRTCRSSRPDLDTSAPRS